LISCYLDGRPDVDPGNVRLRAGRGGDWSSYWYNGRIYESDTRRGLYIWEVSAPEVRGPVVMLDHLNPQTNHLSIP